MKKHFWILLIIVFLIVVLLGIILYINKENANKPKLTLAENVKIGDFVNYNAGVWTQEEIDSLGELYKEKSNEQGKFGKFIAGSSRNDSINSISRDKNIYNGWRVLKIIDENEKQTKSLADDTVYLIHAGTPEAYYHLEGNSYDSEKILIGELSQNTISIGGESQATSRNWNMYINDKYATNAMIFTKKMLEELGTQKGIEIGYNKTIKDDLIKIGASYWLGQAFNLGFVWRVGENGFVGYYMTDSLGVRPVIKLKAGIEISGYEEKIVGTDNTTKQNVWRLK